MTGTGYPLVWVESPLQLVSAAEFAARHGRRLRVAFRLGAQMPQTASELLARGADFGSCEPYVGIPWRELSRASEWIVGDGLSGQFHLAATVLRPGAVTLLDDGAMSLRLAAGLTGAAPFERVGRPASGMRATLGALVRDHLLRLAGRDRLRFFSLYGREDPGFAVVESLGVRLERHDFGWTRRTARAPRLPGTRVLLGSANVVDGTVTAEAWRDEVARHAAVASLVYLPHRRERAAELAAIGELPGVQVIAPGLPVELFLAGAEGLEVLSRGSTADRTLALILGAREDAR